MVDINLYDIAMSSLSLRMLIWDYSHSRGCLHGARAFRASLLLAKWSPGKVRGCVYWHCVVCALCKALQNLTFVTRHFLDHIVCRLLSLSPAISEWLQSLSQLTMKQLLISLLDSGQWSSQSHNASVQPSLEWSSSGSPVCLSLAVFLLMKVHTAKKKKPIMESFISPQIPSITRCQARSPTSLVRLGDIFPWQSTLIDIFRVSAFEPKSTK